MDEPDEDVLMTNQLCRAHIDEKHQYECYVCPKNDHFDNVDDHVNDELHIRALEQFYVQFKGLHYRGKCTICEEEVDWETLRAHAKTHQIVPWHEPETKYEIFIQNRIIECDEKFYCCLCEIEFADWSTAFLHIDDWPHQSLKDEERFPLPNDFLTKIPKNLSCKFLVTEALLPRDDKNFECRICGYNTIVELINIDEHVNTFFHKWYKKNLTDFKTKLTSKAFSEKDKKMLFIDSFYEKKDDKKVTENLRCYLVKKNEKTLHCFFCDCSIFASSKNINIHALGKFHIDSVKKRGCDFITLKENDNYYCECCKIDIVGIEAIYSHVKDMYHPIIAALSKYASNFEKNLLKLSDTIENSLIKNKTPEKKIEEIPKKTEPVVVATVRPFSNFYIRRPRPPKPLEPLFPNIVFNTIPSNYIKRENSTDSRCVLCNFLILTGNEEIESHIIGTLHKISMKQYGCEAITLVNGNLYYCRCCNCRIFGDDNVYLHVKGRQHEIEWSTERKKLEEETKSEQPEPKKIILSEILTSEVTKIIEETKSKEATNPRRNGIRLRDPQKILPEEVNWCNECKIRFANCGDLHSHLAGHFSEDFTSTVKINPKFSRNQNSLESTMKISDKVLLTEKNSKNQENLSLEKNSKNPENLSMEKNVKTQENCKSSECIHESTICELDENSNCRTPTKSIIQKIVKLANFDQNEIYDLKDKLREIELGMKFSLITEPTKIYCLVCRNSVVNTLQNFFEHLRSLEHCDYLEKMEQDAKLFFSYPEQFSEIDLAFEYMEEISDQMIRCFICNEEIENFDDEIHEHLIDENHEKIREEMHARAENNFLSVKSRMHCDWYNVQKYWCVLCEAMCETETSFVKHLESPKHAIAVRKSENSGRSLIYDFCPPCALLWYGYRCTYAYHCDVTSHKWLTQDGHYILNELTEFTKNHLVSSETYVDYFINCLDEVATKERSREQNLMQDLEYVVKSKFSNAKAYGYGSRISGLGGPDSDFDVFLDCGNRYNGSAIFKDELSSLMTDVHRCLNKYPFSWDLYELLTNCRTPIIRACHRATGLSCDISFENGLSVENTKLLKSFNDVYPPCRKMIIILKKWLTLCKLSGSDQISNYALCWSVIFYLQKEFILPSIATLTRMNSRSHEIAGWEIGISREYSYNKIIRNFSVKELLVRYFKFYANFDFRQDVVCPLLGVAISKLEFADHRKLPKEMRPYIDHMNKSREEEPLRVDSPMCIQDPIDLQHNITKAVSKACLNRFRTCCSKSVDVILNSS